jgi:hypothetical protein
MFKFFLSIIRINLQFGPGVLATSMATVIENLAIINLFMPYLLFLAIQVVIPFDFLVLRFMCFYR